MSQFGAGTRSCLGKNISYLEIYKVVPELVMRYEFKLADPETKWTLENEFFVYPRGVLVKGIRRASEREFAQNESYDGRYTSMAFEQHLATQRKTEVFRGPQVPTRDISGAIGL
jgi:hypothetical protein